MELNNIQLVALYGFLLAVVFGAVANKTNFCTMGAVSDWVNMGSKGRLAAWVLAMGIAVAGAQLLELTGLVELESSIYRGSTFGLGGYIVGGLLFGIGMTLGGGCGQRTLVRVGSGNLKSLVVFLILGVTAYATLRGLLGVVRVEVFDPASLDLSVNGMEEQGLASLLAHVTGIGSSNGLKWVVAGVVSFCLIGWALRQPALKEDSNNLVAGVVVGLLITGAWISTGILGLDDFDPVPVEGMSFISPTGNTVSFFMTYTGATINFGIAVVLGVIVGSLLYAIFTRTFAIETFNHRSDMINHMWGGALMGFGGVLSLGCTIGQGVSGISTLALGSFIATFFIILGSAITMRVQYYRLDELSLGKALFVGVADIVLPWRKLD